jgi:hypothetical protein
MFRGKFYPHSYLAVYTKTVFDLFCKAVRCRLDSERFTGSINVSFWTDQSTHHSKSRAALCRDGTLKYQSLLQQHTTPSKLVQAVKASDLYSGCAEFESRQRRQLSCLRLSLLSLPLQTSARIMTQNWTRPLILQLIIHSKIPQYTVRQWPSPNKPYQM